MQGSLAFDLDHPYLKKQLIAYIGNKRALKPLLYRVFTGILAELGPAAAPRVFLDPFAGSGAVARLARFLGFRVLANDWEPYAYVLNFAHLCLSAAEADGLFRSRGGPSGMLAQLNALPPPREEQRYISRYYAPASTEGADYRRERLFYTRENALKIDAVRSRIEELYPGGDLPDGADVRGREKLLLLAALLYQCATHTNTSGVFKACHKGFGGHGRDALGRIMAPIALEMPLLFDGEQPAEAGCQDAAAFVRGRPADICYLDPPYNQHQYGSNYHLLNTIALWDRPPVSDALRPDGRLKHKAGIRPDWVRTRSAYCYRRSAPAAFRELLQAIDARHVVVSYNTEGIIPFAELVELLQSQGRLELFSNEYVKYRGGKQSLARQVHNIELVLVLDRRSPAAAADRCRLERAVLANRLAVALKRSFCPEKVRRVFSLEAGGVAALPVRLDGRTLHLPMPHLYRFSPGAAALAAGAAGGASPAELRLMIEKLELCECADRREEIEVLLAILHGAGAAGEAGAGGEEAERPRVAAARPEAEATRPEAEADREALQKRILWLLRKFAHRKYRESFEQTVALLQRFAFSDPRGNALLLRGLEEVSALARARFRG